MWTTLETILCSQFLHAAVVHQSATPHRDEPTPISLRLNRWPEREHFSLFGCQSGHRQRGMQSNTTWIELTNASCHPKQNLSQNGYGNKYDTYDTYDTHDRRDGVSVSGGGRYRHRVWAIWPWAVGGLAWRLLLCAFHGLIGWSGFCQFGASARDALFVTMTISANKWSRKGTSPHIVVSNASGGAFAASPQMKGCLPPTCDEVHAD